MQFVLTIDLGNEAMQTGHDVAEALVGVAYHLRDVYLALDTDFGGRALNDENGNAVGRWEVTA